MKRAAIRWHVRNELHGPASAPEGAAPDAVAERHKREAGDLQDLRGMLIGSSHERPTSIFDDMIETCNASAGLRQQCEFERACT
jgi:hypothetical protein